MHLPQSYWEFSVEFAVCVYNRTPVKHIAWHTPFEVLNSTKPDISHLRVFGCEAYVYIPDDVWVNKLTPRAEVMTFLSYTSGMKGFKFMWKPNNVIFHSVTTMFDEHMFPSCPDNISLGSTCIGCYVFTCFLLFFLKQCICYCFSLLWYISFYFTYAFLCYGTFYFWFGYVTHHSHLTSHFTSHWSDSFYDSQNHCTSHR